MFITSRKILFRIKYCTFILMTAYIYDILIQSGDTVVVTNSRFRILEILFFLLSVKARL